MFTTHARCADPKLASHALPPTSSLAAVRVSLCVEEKMDVCSEKELLEMPDNELLTIVVAVVAAIVFVLVILILVVFFCRKNKNTRRTRRNKKSSSSAKKSSSGASAASSSAGLDVEIGGGVAGSHGDVTPPPLYDDHAEKGGVGHGGVIVDVDGRMTSITPDSGFDHGIGRQHPHPHQHDNPALEADQQYLQMSPPQQQMQQLQQQQPHIFTTQTPYGNGSLGGHYQNSHRGSNNPSRMSGAFVAQPVSIASAGYMDWHVNNRHI